MSELGTTESIGSSSLTPETKETVVPKKLYANKFETIEDLENGYNNAAKVYQENETLSKKLSELTNVPEDYRIPEDIKLSDDESQKAKMLARKMALSQIHFEKVAREIQDTNVALTNKLNEAKKDIGENRVNLLKDFVSRFYPESVQAKMLNLFLTNKDAREGAFKHREAILSSAIPGINGVTTTPLNESISAKKLEEAWRAHQKDKGNRDKMQTYLNLVAQKAHER